MTKHHTVSVVVPAYGRQSELSFALRSLMSDAEYISEVVVIDDGSPDPLKIDPPAPLGDRTRLIRLPKNVGSSAARQTGVDEATSDLIAFLDSDDTWLPGKLSAQMPFFSANGVLLAVATGWQYYDAKSRETSCIIPAGASSPTDFAAGCWFCPGSTVVVSRSTLSRIGPFDIGLRRLEDLDWFLRFGLAGGRLAVAETVGAVIRRDRGKNNRANVEAAARQIAHKFAREPQIPIAVRHNLSAYLELERAAAAYRSGDPVAAMGHGLRSLFHKPRAQVHLQKWWREENPRLSVTALEDILGIAEAELVCATSSRVSV